MKYLLLLAVAVSVSAQTSTRPVPVKKAVVVKTAPENPPAPKPSVGKPVPAKGPAAAPAKAAAADPPKPKPTKSETLHFTVNWPSGLSLGEGVLTAVLQDGEWSFSMKADAAVPGFAISEGGKSRASAEYCSTELHKTATRGKKVVDETTTFDAGALRATRTTSKGGKSEFRIPACAKDAIAFLFFVRKELAAGRIPPAQPVYYGAAYNTRVVYAGTQRIQSNHESVEADKLTAHIKGPVAELTVDLFFARDTPRTPLLAQFGTALGKFSVEFSR
jgi:hypothetical protein